MVRGEGLRTWDVDGNEYRDFLGNYTSLILGHAHPAVVEAVERQVRRARPSPRPPRSRSSWPRRSAAGCRRSSGCGSRTPAPRRRCSRSGRPGRSPADRSSPASTAPTTGPTTRSLPGTPGVPDGDLRPRRRPAVGRPRRRRAQRSPAASATIAAIIIEPVQGAGGVRAADPAFLRFLRELADRIGRRPDLRRDHRVPGRAERRPGRLRRPAGPDDARQDHRRRLPARGVRRTGRDHGPLRRAAARRAEPRRDVQRQPGRRRRRARDAARADAGPLRAPGRPRRAPPGALADGIAAGGIDARVDGIASLFQVFAGPTLTGEDGLTRQPDAVPRAPRRRLPSRAARDGRDLDPGDRGGRRRPGRRGLGRLASLRPAAVPTPPSLRPPGAAPSQSKSKNVRPS